MVDAGKARSERANWDAIARSIPDLAPAYTTQYYRQCEIALIRRILPKLAGLRVLKLDLWNEAVNTRILNWMERQGAETYRVDLSSVTVRRAARNARRQASRMRLSQSDIRLLPFASGVFDFVYTMGTIEHVAEHRKAVAEVQRVLKPGGLAVVGVPYKWNLFLRPLLVAALDRFGKYPYSPEKAFSWKELRGVLEECGFQVVSRTGLLSAPGILRMGELFLYRRKIPLYRLSKWLVLPFELLETRWSWPGRLGYLVAAVVRKPTRPRHRAVSGKRTEMKSKRRVSR